MSLGDPVSPVYRETNDRPSAVAEAALDALADPPGRVGREVEAALEIEPVHGAHEAGVAFLAEIIEEGWPPAAALLGDVDQQPQVSLRRVTREICPSRPPTYIHVAHATLSAELGRNTGAEELAVRLG